MKKIACIFLLFFIAKLSSQNISLDTTFGTDGFQDSLSNGNFLNSAILLPDGKILISGTLNASTEFFIAKYNVDGSPDTSFGTNGFIITNSISNQKETIYGMDVQSDGKIIVVGQSDINPSLSGFYYHALLARFNADGSTDTTFGTNGYVKTELGSDDDYLSDIQITATGDIYVVGYSKETATGYSTAKIAKYDALGNLDTAFATNGIQTVSLAKGVNLNEISVQNDGTLFLSGSSIDLNDNKDTLLVKLDVTGNFDASFGTNGMQLTDIGYTNEYITDFVLHNNKILATGTVSGTSFLPHTILMRFNLDGTLDTTFSIDGFHIETPDASNYSTSFGKKISVLPDGTILASGHAIGNNNYDLFLIAFNDDGTRVTNFGTNGQYLHQVSARQDYSSDLLIQPDGKIIVTGAYSSTSTNKRNMLIRFKDAYVLSNAEFELEDTVVMYPNPTANTLHIKTNTSIEKIIIHTLSGQLVKEIISSENTVAIDFLASGTYIIKVISSQGTIVSKFIKL
ncbi:hypothetical protein IMCC3317_02080 [Kordia antarctica]|uniref:Secretion system C-terminal sorting domain-containing protein n=1 Tax=Kordia antarctica TaxID=1218801 RepID=A0A7L4ZDM0_9FLAO|nr:T9SS type A sorting domain-containing protein [Kordia antarctica]QHI34863.1 hypothetical protein IMCC3317_02080 [Kordia antarctica]